MIGQYTLLGTFEDLVPAPVITIQNDPTRPPVYRRARVALTLCQRCWAAVPDRVQDEHTRWHYEQLGVQA